MPSQSSRLPLAALVTAVVGFGVAGDGETLHSRSDSIELAAAGMLLVAVSVMTLLVDAYRARRRVAAAEQRIQGEAFALAIELWRKGDLADAVAQPARCARGRDV